MEKKTFEFYVSKTVYERALSELIKWTKDSEYNEKWYSVDWKNEGNDYGWMKLIVEKEQTLFWIGYLIAPTIK